MSAPARLGLFFAALGAVFGLSFLGGRVADGPGDGPAPTTVPSGGHGDHGAGGDR